MNYKHLDGFNHEAKIVYRSNKPVYKRENVLTTDVIPIAGFSEVTELFPDVFSQHPDAWFLHYEFFDKDTDLIRKRVPSILNAFNRSRVLRREKISGVRVCNIDCTRKIPRCVNDMVISSTYGAVLIASLADTFQRISDQVIITFKPVPNNRDRKRWVALRSEELMNRFWRRSHLPKSGIILERIEDDDPLMFGVFSWRLSTSKPIFDILFKLLTILYDEIDDVQIGSKGYFRLSKSPTADPGDYMYRPVDKLLYNIRYRRYSAFGIYHNNPKYLLY